MTRIKIASYNIQLSKNVRQITENIVHMAKDGVAVFCLQEILEYKNQQFIGDHLRKALGPSWEIEYYKGEIGLPDGLQTGILWNSKVLTCKKVLKFPVFKIDKFAPHEWLYSVLTGSFRKPILRKVVSVVLIFKNINIRITSLHTDHVGGPKHRAKQLAYIFDKINKEQKLKFEIVCGDFNTFDFLNTGQERKAISKILGADFIDASEAIAWTADLYNMDMPKAPGITKWLIKSTHLHIRRKLDYIWVKNLKIIECRRLDLSGSDHYPIIATLALPEV
jgi:endonuclease/exonuclease/phosphatase family metal-dependent hydrolase